MEEVFMYLWLADIAGGVGVFGAMSLLALVALFVVAGTRILFADFDTANQVKNWPGGFKHCAWLLLPAFVALVTPSSATFKWVAVSKSLSYAANTNVGTKGLAAIDAVLDKVIKESKK